MSLYLAFGLLLLELLQLFQVLLALSAPFVDVHLQLFIELGAFLVLAMLRKTKSTKKLVKERMCV